MVYDQAFWHAVAPQCIDSRIEPVGIGHCIAVRKKPLNLLQLCRRIEPVREGAFKLSSGRTGRRHRNEYWAEKRQAAKKYDLVHDMHPQVHEPTQDRERLTFLTIFFALFANSTIRSLFRQPLVIVYPGGVR